MELHHLVAERENDIRLAGQRAFDEGKRIDDCPHRPHTREADLWRRGFANAQYGALMAQRT
jgi:hypothetical protein